MPNVILRFQVIPKWAKCAIKAVIYEKYGSPDVLSRARRQMVDGHTLAAQVNHIIMRGRIAQTSSPAFYRC